MATIAAICGLTKKIQSTPKAIITKFCPLFFVTKPERTIATPKITQPSLLIEAVQNQRGGKKSRIFKMPE